MYDRNLTMNFPPDFHNCTGLNGLVNSLSNLPLLHQINRFKAANLTDLQIGKNNIM